MRLLIAGINWPPETFIARLIDGLVLAGVSVTVGSAKKPVGMEDRVKWLPTPSWDANIPMRLARLAGMAIRAKVCAIDDVSVFRPYVRRSQAFSGRLQVWSQLLPYAGRRWDLIYFPWNSAAIAHLPVFDLPSPVVLSCRGTQVSVAPHNPERAEIRTGLRKTFERAAAVHCVSQATLKDACQSGLDPAKATVIRPAVDPEMFRPASNRPDSDGIFRVVTTGNLNWVKGHEWALSAIRLLKDRGVHVQFDIIGDGPDRQRVLYTVRDLGLQDCVQLHGRVGSKAVLSQLQQADTFLLSSLSEGISNAVLEAMACGIPVVTTDCGGMREAVTDGVEGFLVPVRDAEAMAVALQRLAGDSSLRQTMGHAGRARITYEFGVKQQVEQWLGLFHSVLSHNLAGTGASLDGGSQRKLTATCLSAE
jgi:glycosyltransferase involved in cell wall biosynthesis